MWKSLCWLVLAAVVLAGCAQAPADQSPPEQASEAPHADVDVPGDGAGDHEEREVAQEGDGLAAEDAAELRTTLEKLLGHHSTHVARFMRSRIAGDPDFFESAVSALSRNTDDLTEVVESVYDADAAAAFRDLWVDHTQAFFAYAAGLAEDDEAAREEAVAALDAYRADFGQFTEEATAGELPADVVSEVLGEHIDHLLGLADAYAAEDYATAYQLQREAYTHMFPTGTSLAGGFAQQLPGEFPVAFDDAPAQLRSALGMLLGEHVELGIDAMRAGVTGAPDFEAVAGAVEANTGELTEAIEALAGPDHAARFSDLWGDHVDNLVAYTVAVAEDDDQGRDAAMAGLADYEEAFGAFLEDVTASELDAAAVTETMHVHDTQLIDQIEAYAEEDFATAHDVAFDTYQHVFETAAVLADAIEARMGGELPVGGAATGGGGTADGAHGR